MRSLSSYRGWATLSNAITALQAALAVIFDLLWRPLQLLGVGYQLVLVAIIFGIVMVLLYGRISKQAAIKRVKNEIAAGLLEVVLFRRDIQISLRAQGVLLLAGMRYFLLAMGPVLILAIPFTIIFGHLNLRLGARPFAVGEEGVLSVAVAKGSDVRKIFLQAPKSFDLEGPVRVLKSDTLFWRLKATAATDAQLMLSSDGATALKQELFVASDQNTPAAGIFLSKREWVMQMLFPNGGSAQSLGSTPFESVELTYPQRVYTVLGIQFSWISAFLIISICAGYLGSRIFRISV